MAKIGKISFVLILLLTAFSVQAASFSFSSINSPAVGSTFAVNVYITSNQAVNAVSGIISYPWDKLAVVSVSRTKSVVNLWTTEPIVTRDRISFEGIVLNPGFQGERGQVLQITFRAKQTGTASLKFEEGSILANDGRASNLLVALGSANFSVIPGEAVSETPELAGKVAEPSIAALVPPIITEYSANITSEDSIRLKGQGTPEALTKLVFRNVSLKSFGEQFMDFVQPKKVKLADVLVKNDDAGIFQYISSDNLIAGAYLVLPSLIDPTENVEIPGVGAQLFVQNSSVVRLLILFINVLVLLIPIVALIMAVYFIPWYSFKRMRVIKKKLGFEEEKIEVSTHQLEFQDKIADDTTQRSIDQPERPLP